MKILLTVPLTSFVVEPPHIPDLGIGYIGAALKDKGHEVFIRDWNMCPSTVDFEQWLMKHKPEAVGLKVFTKDVLAAKKTISIIKKILPHVNVIIGGPHPSAVDPEELMNDFTDCDFAIKGEAESSFPFLIDGILALGPEEKKGHISHERAEKTPGLVWRNKDGVYSTPISLNQDLDRINFPLWELLNPSEYTVNILGSKKKEGYTAPIITTRGCPGNCSFCSAYNISGRRIRSRSPSNIIEEMSLLYDRYNVRKFMFQDNCFTSNKENVLQLCEMILQQKMNIEWDCVSYERLDNLTDDILPLLYKAGCRMIHMGIESGSEATRKRMNKSCTLGEITEKTKLLKKNQIKTGAWFMIGFPAETKGEMKETIQYAFSLGADLIMFTIVFPLPGTETYDYIKEKHKIQTIDWSSFDIYNSKYPMSQLSPAKLKALLRMIRFRIRMHEMLRRAIQLLD